MQYPQFIRLLFFFLGLGLTAAPLHAGTSGCLEGDGKIKKEIRELPAFSAVAVDGAFDVRIVCGKKQSLEITADANLLPVITTTVKAKTLYIDTSRSICTKSDLLVTIAIPDIGQADLGGAADMNISGLSNPKFILNSDGAGDITLGGKTSLFHATLKGSTDLEARQFIADTVQIRVYDAGEAVVQATQKLDAAVTGAATVTYFGNPKTVNKKAADAGEIVSGDKAEADEEEEEND